MAELTDLKIWLWNNREGLHTTVVTNYGTPFEKRSFFAFAGENTAQGFKAYRDKQPTALKEYFAEKRKYLEPVRFHALEKGFEVRISKLVENTGNNGRRVLRGCMLLMYKPGNYQFVAYLGDNEHMGEFNPDLVTARQRNCLGAYYWKKPTEAEEDWGEAF